MSPYKEPSLIPLMNVDTSSSVARSRFFLVFVILLLSACKTSKSTSSPDDALLRSVGPLKSLTLVPGVVIEPERGQIYVMRPTGGIRSLRIDDGTEIWASSQVDVPIFVTGKHLVGMIDAKSTNLDLAILNPDNGERAQLQKPNWSLPLPIGSSTRIDDSLESRFRLGVETMNNDVVLTWDSLQREVFGVAPEGKRAPERRSSGAFLFRDGEFVPVSPDTPMPSAENWPSKLADVVESGRFQSSLLQTNSIIAATAQQYSPERLVLMRWRAHDQARLDDVVLHQGRALAALPSCDRQHFVVASANKDPNTVRARPYVLQYFEIGAGDLIAEFPSSRSAGPFCLLGQRLMRLSQPELRRVDGVMISRPLEIVAIDIVSGAPVWRSEVRDTAFRGHAPPGN